MQLCIIDKDQFVQYVEQQDFRLDVCVEKVDYQVDLWWYFMYDVLCVVVVDELVDFCQIWVGVEGNDVWNIYFVG